MQISCVSHRESRLSTGARFAGYTLGTLAFTNRGDLSRMHPHSHLKPALAAIALALFALAQPALAQDKPPNLLLEIRKPLVDALAVRAVDRTEPVRDYILKTDIEGTGRTTGQVTAQLIPSAEVALFDFVLEAQTVSQTIGYRGPVQLYRTSLSSISSRQRVWFTPDGLVPEPANSANSTDSTLNDITSRFELPLLDCLLRKAAARKYAKSHDRAQRITEQHVDQRVAPRVDQDVQEELDSANRWYRERFRGPLRKHGIFADALSTATTDSALYLTARLENAAPTSTPPAVAAISDASVRLHESLLNEGARKGLAGKTYNGPQIYAEVDDPLGPFRRQRPRREPSDRPELAITFAAERPIEFGFDNNLAKVGIHGSKFPSEGPQ